MPCSFMAFLRSASLYFPSLYNAYKVAVTICLASTSKKSRNSLRPSLRPKPSVPKVNKRFGNYLQIESGSVFT